MSSLLKGIGGAAASFIPGVGPLLGAAIGGIGGSGKQSSQTQTSTNTTDQTITPNEAAYFGQGRQDLTSGFQDFLKKSQQPIYGNAAKASVFNDLNDLASDSIGKLRGQIGARGNSGFNDSATAGIEQARYGGLADFLTKLPGMESQAQFDRGSQLYGQGMNFFGRAPVGQTTKGTTSGNTEGTLYGQPAGGGFLSNLGGIMGGQAGYQQGADPWNPFASFGKGGVAPQSAFGNLPLFGLNGPRFQ